MMTGVILVLLAAMFLVQKRCRKRRRLILSIVIGLAILYGVLFTVDQSRVERCEKPIFYLGYRAQSGMTEYVGLGYRTVVEYGYSVEGEEQITGIKMYFLDWCVAAADQ